MFYTIFFRVYITNPLFSGGLATLVILAFFSIKKRSGKKKILAQGRRIMYKMS
jgi:hypothetical protein